MQGAFCKHDDNGDDDTGDDDDVDDGHCYALTPAASKDLRRCGECGGPLACSVQSPLKFE